MRPAFEINGVEPRVSPDGRLEALVNNYNVAIRETGKREITLLSADGSEGTYFDPDSLAWSPDSKRIAAYRVTPGHRRYVHFVQSSPEDQLQPKHSTMQYAKPGDVLDVEIPVLFEVQSKKRLDVDRALFPNAYDVSRLTWKKDSSAVTFEYNQRGHQVFRVIEIDAASAKTRTIISEEPKTFFCLPDQLRRRQPGDADARGRQSFRELFTGPLAAGRHLFARGRRAGDRAAIGEGRRAGGHPRDRGHRVSEGGGMEAAGSLGRQGA